ncbi:MAG: 30S ribosomal protein S20 [Deltaproteobacteria bacterium]|nr:30S ribosomal protein S20 [Deltaproteobacteria bacterium]
MATHSSAVKRHKQSLKRRDGNMVVKSGVKTAIKKVRDAVKEGNREDAKTCLVNAVKLLDKAVSKGILHRNNASRRISNLTTAVNSIAAK